MKPAAVEIELAAIRVRAADVESKRQFAEARGEVQAVREHEVELSRLYSRACDLEQQHYAA